jgi:serine/threonine protein kinase
VTRPESRLSAALADRYRIERELGAGGMATVYLAEDLKHQRRVAIKVLRPDIAQALGAAVGLSSAARQVRSFASFVSESRITSHG